MGVVLLMIPERRRKVIVKKCVMLLDVIVRLSVQADLFLL
jgi:hypothetical protein